jgi:hypothetical protein
LSITIVNPLDLGCFVLSGIWDKLKFISFFFNLCKNRLLTAYPGILHLNIMKLSVYKGNAADRETVIKTRFIKSQIKNAPPLQAVAGKYNKRQQTKNYNIIQRLPVMQKRI